MIIRDNIHIKDLQPKIEKFWEYSAEKIKSIQQTFDPQKGAPVFTVKGKYTSRGWTEWTQGFQYGSAILQFEATGEKEILQNAVKQVKNKMAPHLTHIGVHDHGFNNISTYGNLLRLMETGRIPAGEGDKLFYQLALKVSGAVQASRWTNIQDGGFIHSFNGPHSLFVDTIRSCRILMLSHFLGHYLAGENDVHFNLFHRACQHIKATSDYSIYYGEGRDQYDISGRTAHESVFNTHDGNYRCPNSQQGYSGFTTWTRGLAWAICGFAEELELLSNVPEGEFEASLNKEEMISIAEKAAKATCDFYIEHTPKDGIPYWDTGAPGLVRIADYLNKDADPFNAFEPVDSSAACIAAQGLLRFGYYLNQKDPSSGDRYIKAGLCVTERLFDTPYLCSDPDHQGLILHAIYHHPNGWDHIPAGSKIPYGESCMWGDYHARELAIYLKKIIDDKPYYTFFQCIPSLNSTNNE